MLLEFAKAPRKTQMNIIHYSVMVIFNNSIGKDSVFALPKDINLEVYINRYTESMLTLTN